MTRCTFMTLKSQTERCEIRQIFRSSLILKQLRRGDFFGASEPVLFGFIPTSDSQKNSPLYCSPCVSCCVVRTRLKPPPPQNRRPATNLSPTRENQRTHPSYTHHFPASIIFILSAMVSHVLFFAQANQSNLM